MAVFLPLVSGLGLGVLAKYVHNHFQEMNRTDDQWLGSHAKDAPKDGDVREDGARWSHFYQDWVFIGVKP